MAVQFTTCIDLWCFFYLCSFVQGRRHIEEDKLDFKGGNVHVITSKEDWDRKIEEANKDGKIVSKLAICSMDYKYIFWFLCCALVGDLSVCFTLYNFTKLISMHYLSHGPFLSFLFFFKKNKCNYLMGLRTDWNLHESEKKIRYSSYKVRNDSWKLHSDILASTLCKKLPFLSIPWFI